MCLRLASVACFSSLSLVSFTHCAQIQCGEYSVCVAPATERVNFTDSCSTLASAEAAITITALQQEYESVQLLVRGSSTFTVDVDSTLPFPLQKYMVGYVFTRHNSRVGGSGGGWRPDPLLSIPDDVASVKVPADFTQPLWLTWHVNATSAANESGMVQLRISDDMNKRPPVTCMIPAAVRVAQARMPGVMDASTKQVWQYSSSNLEHYYGNNTVAMSQLYLDMLRQHRMPNVHSGDNSPRTSPLVQFALDIKHAVPSSCSGKLNQTLLQNGVAKAKKDVEDLKAAGWPEGSIYGYGKDEAPENCKKLLAEAYAAVKRAVPGMKIIAAANWNPKHMTPDFPMDAWVHQYELYSEDAAARWVAAGKEYWGYHCVEPSGAHNLNTFIERPLIEARLLFWYAASRRYEGWLFWAVDLWKDCAHNRTALRLGNASHPALLDFDPASYIWCPHQPKLWVNGDGYLMYPGPRGPINSVRLEGIRDGLEDWEMFRLLQPEAAKASDRSAISKFTSQLVQKSTYTERPGDAARLEAVRRAAVAAVEAHGAAAAGRTGGTAGVAEALLV
eukprot:TRINITY_DN73252_c0_g1_i1.p1 TRINITY_DN73252_c0_g1~~TRINITY_DN73252_c0_g1_i1.p1  ORF type:complete len:560 (-),score=93.14 TRINITY_DN73252_c0_g1_i1:60-1739(-)